MYYISSHWHNHATQEHYTHTSQKYISSYWHIWLKSFGYHIADMSHCCHTVWHIDLTLVQAYDITYQMQHLASLKTTHMVMLCMPIGTKNGLAQKGHDLMDYNRLFLQQRKSQLLYVNWLSVVSDVFPNNMMVLLWKIILNSNFIITHVGVGGLLF